MDVLFVEVSTIRVLIFRF